MTTFTTIAGGWRSLTKGEVPSLTVGQEVWLWSTGSMRLAVITDVARTRVTVGFTQKNGTVRSKTVPAADVRLPEGEHLVAPGWLRTHHDRRTLVVGNEDVAVWRALPRHSARKPDGGYEWTETWEANMTRNHEHAVKMLNDTVARRPSLVVST